MWLYTGDRQSMDGTSVAAKKMNPNQIGAFYAE
jgi:hypothetical protein